MGFWLAISVGPILFTVIKQSLESGIRGGFSFVAGIWISDILFVVLSNSFTVFTAHFADTYIKQIGYGGGLLLLGLGDRLVIVFQNAVDAGGQPATADFVSWMRGLVEPEHR